jgi:PST family polysaccharide transporter
MALAMPGLAISTLLTRIGIIPERLLVRKLDFRVASLGRGLSEVVFPIVAVACAIAGLHGMSIVAANIARSVILFAWMAVAMPLRNWIRPTAYDTFVVKDIFRFGFPFTIAMLCNNASRTWDNLLMARMFGPAMGGLYTQAYNLTEIPVIQVTEQVGDVLTPSMVNLSKEDRKSALVRSTALTCLVVFPLTIGLACVAPTLVSTLLRKEWAGVAPFLAILAALAVVRPVGTLVASYLQSSDRPKSFMALNIVAVVALLGLITLLGWLFGPYWACAGVGLGFGISSFVAIVLVCHQDKIRWQGFAKGYILPLLACIPMILLVLGTRRCLDLVGLRTNWLRLCAEVLFGAIGYAGGAFTIARPITKDFVGLVKETLARKRGHQ